MNDSFLEEFKDPFSRSRGLLEHVRNIRDLGDRMGERPDVLDEGLDVPDGNGLPDRQPSSQDAYRYVPQVADEHHDGHHQPGKELGFPGRIVERVVQAGKPGDTLLLAVECPHHQVSSEHLLHMAVDVAYVLLLLLEVFLGTFDDKPDHHHGEGKHDQGHHSHQPADGKHHDEDAYNAGDGGDDLRKALAQGTLVS